MNRDHVREAEDFSARLASDLPDTLEIGPDSDPVVAYWTTGRTDDAPTVVVGSAHNQTPIFRLTVTRLSGEEEARARRGLGRAYDDQQAGFWEETPESFEARLAAGHLFDAYEPYEGGPAWPHREAHARWREEQRREHMLSELPESGEGVQWAVRE